jgi:Protein of unknown function (DUF3609).
LNDVLKREEELRKESIITEMYLETEVAIAEFNRNIDILTNAVMLAKGGQVDPRIVSPALLLSILETIRNERGSHELPIPVSEDNYFEYLEVSEITIATVNRRLIYKISIPILELGTFESFRVIPVPKLVKENLFCILTFLMTISLLTMKSCYTRQVKKLFRDL